MLAAVKRVFIPQELCQWFLWSASFSEEHQQFHSKKIQKQPKKQQKSNFSRYFCGISVCFDTKFIKAKLKMFLRRLSDKHDFTQQRAAEHQRLTWAPVTSQETKSIFFLRERSEVGGAKGHRPGLTSSSKTTKKICNQSRLTAQSWEQSKIWWSVVGEDQSQRS